MGAELANALLVEAPMTLAELHTARMHYQHLADILRTSGPRFGNALRDAVTFHNIAARRITGVRREAARRAALQDEPELLEIRA
jgi:hypothetical protein